MLRKILVLRDSAGKYYWAQRDFTSWPFNSLYPIFSEKCITRYRYLILWITGSVFRFKEVVGEILIDLCLKVFIL